MTWKTWLLLIFALVAGSVASYAVRLAFFDENPAQVVDESSTNGPKERLLVANGFIPAGAELTAENVRLTLTPEKDVPRDGIFSFSEFAGRKTTRDYKDGEPISLYDIEAIEDEQDEELAFVPPGCSVVPIEINSAMKTNGSRNYLKTTKLEKIVKPGDLVDFIVVKEDASTAANSGNANTQRRRLVSTTIVDGAEVFSVSDTSRLSGEGAVRSSILSALLTSEQLEQVRKASEEGKIKIILEDQDESSIEFSGPGVNDPLGPVDGSGAFTLPPQNIQAYDRQTQSHFGSSNNLLSDRSDGSLDSGVSVNQNFVMPDFANGNSDDAFSRDLEIADESEGNVQLQTVSGSRRSDSDSAESRVGTTRDFSDDTLDSVDVIEKLEDENLGDNSTFEIVDSEDEEDNVVIFDNVEPTNHDEQSTSDAAVTSDDSILTLDVADEVEETENDVFRKRPNLIDALDSSDAPKETENESGTNETSEASADETSGASESKPYRGTVKLRSPFVTKTTSTPRKPRQ